MSKRKKWTIREDKYLKELVNKEKIPKWDVISHLMKKKKFNKTSKQCRERWMHQLDPGLIKEKWKIEENKNLFARHKELGNHWKQIAGFFPGRTDNSVKNNFFSLIRKSLRNACKIIGKVSNTKLINKIKPKILSEFIN